MLYQLSYASTGKPSKNIAQATRIASNLILPGKTIARSPLTSSHRVLAVPYYTANPAFSSNAVSLFGLLLDRSSRRFRGRFRRRLRKLGIRQLQVVVHFREVDDKRGARAGLTYRER